MKSTYVQTQLAILGILTGISISSGVANAEDSVTPNCATVVWFTAHGGCTWLECDG